MDLDYIPEEYHEKLSDQYTNTKDLQGILCIYYNMFGTWPAIVYVPCSEYDGVDLSIHLYYNYIQGNISVGKEPIREWMLINKDMIQDMAKNARELDNTDKDIQNSYNLHKVAHIYAENVLDELKFTPHKINDLEMEIDIALVMYYGNPNLPNYHHFSEEDDIYPHSSIDYYFDDSDSYYDEDWNSYAPFYTQEIRQLAKQAIKNKGKNTKEWVIKYDDTPNEIAWEYTTTN